MFVRIWIIGWTYLARSTAVVYKVETEASSKSTVSFEALDNRSHANTIPQWSAWSQWSSCTRSCGGGIRSQTRTCSEWKYSRLGKLSRSGAKKLRKRKCLGTWRRSEICNEQICPYPDINLRTVQCESYNKQAFAGKYYTWEVFYDDRNQCALNCRPLGFNFYASLNKSVIDGSPCEMLNSEKGVCLNGKCKTIGCDGFIGGQQNDICGVCGGDNSTCRLISGFFTTPFLASGYNYITDIPENACNLNISELRSTINLIALRFKNGTYIVNGDFELSPSGKIRAAGTSFTVFKGSNTGNFIFSPGPISQTLELFLLYRQVNPGIKYEYRVPMDKAPLSPSTMKKHRFRNRHLTIDHTMDFEKFDVTDRYETAHVMKSPENAEFREIINDEEIRPAFNKKRRINFKWKIITYTPCTRSCGEGTKIGIHYCVKEDGRDQIVADKKCTSGQGKKPSDELVSCSLQKCPAEWITSEWGQCSVTCGEGIERRDLVCVREVSSLRKEQVDDVECVTEQPANILRTRPCFRKPCVNGSAETAKPYWTTGTWSMCSAKCGPGVKTRTVKCMAESEDECPAFEKPASETTCIMGLCFSPDPAQWLTTEWSTQCTEKCDEGVQSRKVVCSQQLACDEDSKPETTRTCSNNDQCAARWFAGPWSLCSVQCGWGKQTRAIICISLDVASKTFSVVPNSICFEKESPSTEQACFLKPCDVNWYFSAWSSCSKSCNTGLMTRKVVCLHEDFKHGMNCNDEIKPTVKQICNTHKCPIKHEPSNADITRVLAYSDSSCMDEFNNCNLVVKARLCNSKHYPKYCCRSCNGITQS